MEQFSRSTRELISKLLSLSSSADTSAWGDGYVAGVLTLALLLLCCMLLWLIFSYHKALKGVVIPAPNGSIFISARSISDLVKSLDADFNGIVIRKVNEKGFQVKILCPDRKKEAPAITSGSR